MIFLPKSDIYKIKRKNMYSLHLLEFELGLFLGPKPNKNQATILSQIFSLMSKKISKFEK